jgi:hypothetical protein
MSAAAYAVVSCARMVLMRDYVRTTYPTPRTV